MAPGASLPMVPRFQSNPWRRRLVVGLVTCLLAACGLESDEGPGLTVGASWQQARGLPGHRVHVLEEAVPCRACHDLDAESIDEPTVEACRTCHAEQVDHAHGRREGAPTEASTCTTCHVFAGASAADAPQAWDCMPCHAEAQGPVAAVSVHARSTCDSCHEPHGEEPARPQECTSCHDGFPHTHQGTQPTTSEVCSGCHQQLHAAARFAGESCPSCHGEGDHAIPATATFEGGHDDCTTCHRPHDRGAENAPGAKTGAMTAVSCSTCHAAMPVLGGGRLAAHADCKNCHAPHAPKSGVSRACVSCHQGASTDHPQAAAGAVCATCHAPHPPSGQKSPARDCSHCHHDAATDLSFHGKTACEGCHTPHQFKLTASSTDVCSRCHSATVAAATVRKGHAKCDGCHSGLPHRPATLAAACSSCHQGPTRALRKEHGTCRGCHEPHGGVVVKNCDGCHATVAKTAPAGHRACASCHDPHAGSLKKKACTSCHGGIASSTHGGLKGGCDGCHAPHGPKALTSAPACTSCHQQRSGLHRIKSHGTCSDCHASMHRAAVPTGRGACEGCHENMKDHNPDSPRCTGCHLFR